MPPALMKIARRPCAAFAYSAIVLASGLVPCRADAQTVGAAAASETSGIVHVAPRFGIEPSQAPSLSAVLLAPSLKPSLAAPSIGAAAAPLTGAPLAAPAPLYLVPAADPAASAKIPPLLRPFQEAGRKTPQTAAERNGQKIYATMKAIASVLTPDLLKAEWRGRSDNPLFGHCAAASEALFHRLGGKAAGWKAVVIHHQGGTHWFLRHESGRIADITAGQFDVPVPYEKGRGIGFQTKQPSKRAVEILRRIDAAAATAR